MSRPGEVDGEAAFVGADSNDAELLAWVEAELPGVSGHSGESPPYEGEEKTNFKS